MTIEYRYATLRDIDAILQLHARYQVDSINPEDKKDGFITTAFNQDQLSELISEQQGLFIAVLDKQIVAYAMAASWQYWSRWPMFAHMVTQLPNLTYKGSPLSVDNSYQYGPVCVDKAQRGSGVFEGVFYYALEQMAQRYPILVTFVNKVNPRSLAAHTKKVKLDIIQEFEYNNNHYHELACLTQR